MQFRTHGPRHKNSLNLFLLRALRPLLAGMGDRGNGHAGNGWDGHLPSNKLERELINAIEGIEDEDGNKSKMFNCDELEVRTQLLPTHRPPMSPPIRTGEWN